MIPIVTPVRIKGKIYVKMLSKRDQPAEILGCQFRSIAQVKRVIKDCGFQYCTPTAFKVLFS